MAAFIEKVQTGIFNEFMKLFTYKRRRNDILPAPDQQGRRLDLVQLVAQIMTHRRLGCCDHPDGLVPIVDNSEYFIDQIFGRHFRVVESFRCFLFDIFVIAAFGKCRTKSAFKQTRTTGKCNRSDTNRMRQCIQQSDVPSKRVANQVDLVVLFVIDKACDEFDQATYRYLKNGHFINGQDWNDHIILL